MNRDQGELGDWQLEIEQIPSLSPEDLSRLNRPTVDNFQHFAAFSSPATELSYLRITRQGSWVGMVPVVRLSKRKSTDLLTPRLRWWLGMLLGPLARKTSYLLDTAFLAYEHASPFAIASEYAPRRAEVVAAVVRHLKAQRGIESIWISEPTGVSPLDAEKNFDAFPMIPLVHIRIAGCGSLNRFLETTTKKRRRNWRQQRMDYDRAGAVTELLTSPFNGQMLASMQECLRASAARSAFFVPYNDVLTDPQAFATQSQVALISRVGDRVIGFMTFITSGQGMLQTHGGFDYDLSLKSKAYHNLTYDAVAYAIQQGLDWVSLGPLNNETKRRLGTHLLPMTAYLWNRYPLDRWVARQWFIKNFQTYWAGDTSDHPV